MRKRLLHFTPLLLLMAACTDTPTVTGPPDGPAARETAIQCANKAVPSISLSAGATTAQIQDAVNQACNVYLPHGTYEIERPITLPSYTRVHGDGRNATVLVQKSTATGHIFEAKGSTPTAHVTDILVENLGFRGNHRDKEHALGVRTGKRIFFRHNRVTNLGVVYVNILDSYYWNVRAEHLSSNVEVIDNDADGNDSGNPGWMAGISLYYTDGATVSNNRLVRFVNGIEWVGGDANPTHCDSNGCPGDVGNPRWARNITISGNRVRHMGNPSIGGQGAGIWGSMGEGISVFENEVVDCRDYCAGAEGSNNVRFLHNTVAFGGPGALYVLFYSNNVTFQSNSVFANEDRPRLFGTVNPTLAQGNISIRMEGNTFQYTGSTGSGVISKEASRSFYFVNNTLKDVAVSLPGCYSGQCQWNGYTEITGNVLDFTRDAGRDAIYVAHNWDGEQRGVTIADNRISATAAQTGSAIRSAQNTTDVVRMLRNQISGTGFAHARSVSIEGGTREQQFYLDGNASSGGLHNAAAYPPVLVNNTWGGGPPVFTHWSPASGSTVPKDPVVEFVMQAESGIDASSFRFTMNGTDWRSNAAPPTLSSDGKTLRFWSNVMNLPVGQAFTLTAQICSTAGSCAEQSATYTIPGSNPQFTAWDPADGSTLGKDPVVTFTMTDGVGIDPNSFRFTMNGADWRSNAAPPTLSSDGKTLHFWSNVMNLPTGQVTLRAEFCSTTGACAWKQATYTIQY